VVRINLAKRGATPGVGLNQHTVRAFAIDRVPVVAKMSAISRSDLDDPFVSDFDEVEDLLNNAVLDKLQSDLLSKI
jgi:hypothetical protein